VHKGNLEGLRLLLKNTDDKKSFLRGREWYTQWLGQFVSKVYHKYFGHKNRPPLVVPELWKPARPSAFSQYSDRRIDSVVTVFITIMAPTLPTIGAISLYFIDSQLVKLGLIIILNFIFSAAITLVGVPRRIDAFAATATFTAVLIVFVGTSPDCAF